MKFVASLVLAPALVSAAHAAAQYSSNSPSQPPTLTSGGSGQAVQRLDASRLTLLPGPALTSVHPASMQARSIPALDPASLPTFRYTPTPPALDALTTGAYLGRTSLRTAAPEAAKEFSTPAVPATPASLQFDQRLPAPLPLPATR